MLDFKQSFQSSSQASQARPGRPASQASRASKPQASRHRCQQFFFIGAPARFLRRPQAATGRHRRDSPLSLRRPLQSVERVRLSAFLPSSQASPASQASQPSQPASQASQPGQPVIEASGLQASMSAILLYRGSSPRLKAATGRHRRASLQTHRVKTRAPP